MKPLMYYIEALSILDIDNRIRLLHPLGLTLFIIMLPVAISGIFYALYSKMMSFIILGSFELKLADKILEDINDSVTLW